MSKLEVNIDENGRIIRISDGVIIGNVNPELPIDTIHLADHVRSHYTSLTSTVTTFISNAMLCSYSIVNITDVAKASKNPFNLSFGDYLGNKVVEQYDKFKDREDFKDVDPYMVIIGEPSALVGEITDSMKARFIRSILLDIDGKIRSLGATLPFAITMFLSRDGVFSEKELTIDNNFVQPFKSLELNDALEPSRYIAMHLVGASVETESEFFAALLS